MESWAPVIQNWEIGLNIYGLASGHCMRYSTVVCHVMSCFSLLSMYVWNLFTVDCLCPMNDVQCPMNDVQ